MNTSDQPQTQHNTETAEHYIDTDKRQALAEMQSLYAETAPSYDS